MTKKGEARKIFRKWESDFRGFDKRRESIPGNFDQLFFALFSASIEFDVAEALIDDATKVHLPGHSVCKRTYKTMKQKEFYSFEEFVTSWKEDIAGLARESFYRWYDVGMADAPKKIGGMDPQEYTRYKKYVSSFPTVDLKKLREKAEQSEVDEVLDFGDLDG
jgi:hypothetical protein